MIDAFGGSTPADLQQLIGLGPGSGPTVGLLYSGYVVGTTLFNQSGAQRQWNLIDTLSASLGRHQFIFGVDYRRLAPFAIPPNPEVDYFYFSESSVESNSPFTFSIAEATAYPLYKNFSAFAQDDWKVLQRLSLSLGLRWEVNPAPGVTQGLMPYTVQGTDPNTWSLAPQGTPLWKTSWYNFAPRLGVAYILHNTPGRETVVRGGGGVFFDTGQQLGSEGFNGPGFHKNGQFAPGSFPVLPAIPSIVNPPVRATGAYRFSPHLQLPYTLQWNASVEQALGKSQTLTVSYVGSHSVRLLQLGSVVPSNNPNASQFFTIDNGLTSDYDSLQVQFRRRLSQGLTALASYTWSHCLDYGSQNLLLGVFRRGNCDFDVRHSVSAAFSYDLPNAGHGAFVNGLLHHWGLDDRFSARTAFPININGGTFADPLTGQVMTTGVDLVSSQPIYLYGANCASVLQGLGDLKSGQGCPGGRAINPNAFAQSPTDPTTGIPLRPGTAPRNFVRGFGAWQMDLAIRRDFPIHERLKLQFRAEAFNIFNHPNFGMIDPNFGSSTFGQATATLAQSLGVLSPLYQMGGPRSMQFALKVVF